MKAIMLALILIPWLGSCATYNIGDDRDTYSRSEVDAINAEQQCRTLARSTLQAQRCGVRRP